MTAAKLLASYNHRALDGDLTQRRITPRQTRALSGRALADDT